MPNSTVLLDKYPILGTRQFRLGFEVECVLRNRETLDLFKNKLRQIDPNIDCGEDGSIRPQKPNLEMGREIRTPAVYSPQAIVMLEKVFQLVAEYGYTNASCGFHLNFSPVSLKLYHAIDPYKFTKDGLWDRIKKDFKRERNRFCTPVWRKSRKKATKPSKLKAFLLETELDDFYCHEHDLIKPECYHGSAVNFENYLWERDGESRIEIRCFGNTNYHQRFSEICKYADKILNLFLKSCEN